MKIKLLLIGKTEESFIQTGVSLYLERLKHYNSVEILTLPHAKGGKVGISQQKEMEGKIFQQSLLATDFIILLDENGKEHTSKEFSIFLQQKMNHSIKQLVFIIGGPYGFSDELYQRANGKIALSKMTFTHDFCRLIFVEQLSNKY